MRPLLATAVCYPSGLAILLGAALLTLAPAPSAAAFTGEDDQTPGAMALHYTRKNATWGRLDVGYEDSRVKTNPPGSLKVDRRVEALGIFGFDASIGNGSGLRFNIDSSYSKQRAIQEQQPQATIDQTLQVYTPSVDLTFLTDKGLEIVIGAMDEISPAYDQKVASANGSSRTHYHKTAVLSPRAAVVRRTPQWAGGFYYQQGAREARNVDQHAFDGADAETYDEAFIPSIVGVMGMFKGLGSLWNFELDFYQARSIGPHDDNGNPLYTDYFRAIGGGMFDFGGYGLELGVGYQTQSYGNSAFVTIDTIPVSNLKVVFFVGSSLQNLYAGIIGAYGKDGQSLPEFNATYQMYGLAATCGYQLAF